MKRVEEQAATGPRTLGPDMPAAANLAKDAPCILRKAIMSNGTAAAHLRMAVICLGANRFLAKEANVQQRDGVLKRHGVAHEGVLGAVRGAGEQGTREQSHRRRRKERRKVTSTGIR